ncbi:MAG: amidohydrolase family protein [Gammaproteobacteria bacterium]|nr:amidohydrolase family protein [Gammaproteobacteria bacterium]
MTAQMDRNEWLAQVSEEILEPDLPICDPHHHLWDYPNSRYLLDELVADVDSGHNVVSTVFMECGSMYRAGGDEAMMPVGETEFVNGIAAMSASGGYGERRLCASIVGFADLTLGAAVGEVLDAHMSASGRFRGIRHASAWDSSDAVRNSHTSPSEGLLGDATFRVGFSELAKRGLTFDAWLYHPQIPELTALAQAFPDQPIIFDHFGGPLGIGPYSGKRQEIFEYWKGAIADLARCDNVVAKIGGLVMPINNFGFHKADRPGTSSAIADATRDYYLHVIEHFGPERCMLESNFPVDKASCSYAVLWNSFKRITQGFSAADKAALYHDTAAAIYRVET